MTRKKAPMPDRPDPMDETYRDFHASVHILEDGRVEALLQDDPDHPVKELVGRTSQPEAAKFIFNDLSPQMMDLIKEEP